MSASVSDDAGRVGVDSARRLCVFAALTFLFYSVDLLWEESNSFIFLMLYIIVSCVILRLLFKVLYGARDPTRVVVVLCSCRSDLPFRQAACLRAVLRACL
jgi:hypothetical protein